MESESIENDIRMLYFSLVQQFIEENRCLVRAIAAKQMTRDYGMLQQCFRRLHHNLFCMGRLVDIQTLYTGGIRADKQFADEMTRRYEEQAELDQEADAAAPTRTQGQQASGADVAGRLGGAKRRAGRRRTSAAGLGPAAAAPAVVTGTGTGAGAGRGPGSSGGGNLEHAQALEGLIAQMRASSDAQPQQLAMLQSLAAQLKGQGPGPGQGGHAAAAATGAAPAAAASGPVQGGALPSSVGQTSFHSLGPSAVGTPAGTPAWFPSQTH